MIQEVRVFHTSLQFSDGPRAKRRDARRIFREAQKRNWAWITGTEASVPPSSALLRFYSRKAGYRFHRPIGQGVWIAVREDLVDGKFSKGYTQVVPASRYVKNARRPFNPRGVAFVTFNSLKLGGPLTIIAAHYLIQAATTDSTGWNAKIARSVGVIARIYGKGRGIVAYGGDQNTNDKQFDTFHGEPLTSVADELGHYRPTTPDGGYIDCIATYDRDGRVKAMVWSVLKDDELHLETDHWGIEAILGVRV